MLRVAGDDEAATRLLDLYKSLGRVTERPIYVSHALEGQGAVDMTREFLRGGRPALYHVICRAEEGRLALRPREFDC